MTTMLTLQEQLEMEIKENGESDPVVQMLRNQIQAEKSGKNLQELYLSGSVFNPSTSERLSSIKIQSEETKIVQDPCDSLNHTELKHDMKQASDIPESEKIIKN